MTSLENIPPATTKEEDLVTAGQRNINRVWEYTQATIAVVITLATIYCAVSGKDSVIISNAFTLVVALYFVRTNHKKIGGVGGTDSR